MPLVTVRFDHVFDIVSGQQNRRRATTFSFDSALGSQYGVAVPGDPRIESGMTVTAYLKEEGNWQTLVGWKDHATGELAIESPLVAIFSLLLAMVIAAQFAFNAPPKQMAIALAVIGIAVITTCFTVISDRRIRVALLNAADGASRETTPVQNGKSQS